MFTPCDIKPRLNSVWNKIESVEFKIKKNRKSSEYNAELENMLIKQHTGLKKRKGELIHELVQWDDFSDDE